jgi:hypothetical protein
VRAIPWEPTVSEPQGQQPEVPSRLLFHWIKSGLFRVVHADGAYGGISPRGYIHFALYNERAAIPKLSERDVTTAENGSLIAGPERTIEGREGSVREVEVEVIMDPRTALEFFQWFKGKIEVLQKMQNEIASDDSSK